MLILFVFIYINEIFFIINGYMWNIDLIKIQMSRSYSDFSFFDWLASLWSDPKNTFQQFFNI